MTFIQKYSFTEYRFGVQDVTFVVSDSYNDLFTGIGTDTDIFILESVKKDLNTEEGSYAIDELPFSINHLACKTEDDLKAMYFALDATNLKVNRYCGLFFGNTPSLDNMLFIGKIGSKVSGTDKVWSGSDYEYNVNPKREYKFSAYSFDVSILDEVKLTGKIEDLEGNPVSNIYERFESENWSTIKAIFDNRPGYAIDFVRNNIVRFCYLGSLYKVIVAYLSKASDIIQELKNTSFELNLIETSLGIQTCPMSYTLLDEHRIELKDMKAEQSKRVELKLSATDSGLDWSTPFIHRKMIDPELGNLMATDWQKNQASSEKVYSFKNTDNISDLLFEIARSFACYLFISYSSGTTLNIDFKSRRSLVEDEYTYVIGVLDASFDTSSIITKESNEFYGLANNYATDEIDSIVNEPHTINPLPSDKFKEGDATRKYNKEKKGIESQGLLLTTSPTWLHLKIFSHTDNWYPLNCAGTSIPDWTIENLAGGDYMSDAATNNFIREYLHTGLFIELPPFEQTQVQRLGSTLIHRPASRIYARVNETDVDFDSLSKYVNYVLARDKHYYETEYSLTVPFWNGFSKATDGINASWKNIKLGSKIKLAETVKRYDNGLWREEQVQRDYVVVGIEINLQKPETKLKLHSLERFAFGWWDGDEGLLPGLVSSAFSDGSKTGTESNVIGDFAIAAGESIAKGDAVMLMEDGTIRKSLSLSEHQGRTIGIALESGTGDATHPVVIPVQTGGRVYFEDYDLKNIGEMVFARTNRGGINITESILDAPNGTEDMIISLGKIESGKSFILDIMEFPFESGILEQA